MFKITLFGSRDKVSKFISTNTGLNPNKIEDISETHVKGGTITSPPLGNLVFKTAIDNKFAEDPELTKTL